MTSMWNPKMSFVALFSCQLKFRRAARDLYAVGGRSEVVRRAASSSKDPADRMCSSRIPSLLGRKRNYCCALFPFFLLCSTADFSFSPPVFHLNSNQRSLILKRRCRFITHDSTKCAHCLIACSFNMTTDFQASSISANL